MRGTISRYIYNIIIMAYNINDFKLILLYSVSMKFVMSHF